jgi:hypothetical protein
MQSMQSMQSRSNVHLPRLAGLFLALAKISTALRIRNLPGGFLGPGFAEPYQASSTLSQRHLVPPIKIVTLSTRDRVQDLLAFEISGRSGAKVTRATVSDTSAF